MRTCHTVNKVLHPELQASKGISIYTTVALHAASAQQLQLLMPPDENVVQILRCTVE